MSEQDKVERTEIENALLKAEGQAQNDPERKDHQTVMESVRRAMDKER